MENTQDNIRLFEELYLTLSTGLGSFELVNDAYGGFFSVKINSSEFLILRNTQEYIGVLGSIVVRDDSATDIIKTIYSYLESENRKRVITELRVVRQLYGDYKIEFKSDTNSS